MSPLGLGVAYGIGTFVLLFSGMPIAFALGGIALVFMLLFMPHLNLEIVPDIIYSELENITLLTIPLFILMGGAIGKSRAGADLYESLHRWLGRIPGGLGVANVLGCAIFAAMCGSSPATCSAIGSTGIPEMRKLGYSPGFAASIIAAGGTLGILLPPSVVLILYGVATQQSIGRLFMAGVGPGIMMTLMFVVYVMFQYRRDRNRVSASITAEGQRPPDREEFTWAQRFETVPRMAPFVALILAIMFALYGGLATPSETAGVGAIGALLLVCIFYQSYRWSEMSKILRGSMREGCMLILIIGMSLLYSYVMSYLQITQSAATWLVSLDMSKWAFLFWVLVLVIVLGFFLPPVAIILMVVPIVLPALKFHGFDLIWFGVIMSLIMETGLIHPPVGLNLFVIKGIAPDISMREILWGVLPFIILMFVGVVILCFLPEIATWLPYHLYKGA